MPPIYPWKCTACGERVEIVHKITDSHVPPEGACKKCEGTEWAKAPPSGTILNKGASWGAGKGRW